MPAKHPATPRRDSVRNHARLIAAAQAAFATEGFGASVNRIAADAGVNVATLYRHFPTKPQLIAAVVESLVAPLEAVRRHALEHSQAPLSDFLRGAVQVQAEHRGLVDALAQDSAIGAEVRDMLRQQALTHVAPIADAAYRSGELRAELDATDVLVVLSMLGRAMLSPVANERGLARYIDTMLRGLAP